MLPGWAGQIRFIDGVFVGVGPYGGIATSTNGQAWHLRESGTSHDLYGMSWDSRLFVVGDGGTILENSPWEPPVARLEIGPLTTPKLLLHSPAGSRYRLEISEDLKQWQPFDEFDVPLDTINLTGSLGGLGPSKFFRAVYLGAIDSAAHSTRTNPVTRGASPPASIANSVLALVPVDAEGSSHTVQLDASGLYRAWFNDGTEEQGDTSYTRDAEAATLLLVPANGSTVSTIVLQFDLTGNGTYTSDTLGVGNFRLAPLP